MRQINQGGKQNEEKKHGNNRDVVCIMMMATGVVWAGGTPIIPGVGVPNATGTVTDTSTGLVWLQNANCFGLQRWDTTMNSAKSLKSGACGLTDGSTAGQWRLPTKDELVKRLKNQQGFNNVQANLRQGVELQ